MSGENNKNEVITGLLNMLSSDMTKSGGWKMSRSEALKNKKCVKCGDNAIKFKDAPSKKEYTLTAWCQKCQDDFFG